MVPYIIRVLNSGAEYQIGGHESRTSVSASTSSSVSGHGNSDHDPKIGTSSNGLLYPEYHVPPKGNIISQYELSDLEPVTDSHISRVHSRGQLQVSHVQHQGVEGKIEGAPRPSYESGNPFNPPDGSAKHDVIETFPTDNDITDQHARLIDNDEITYDQAHAQPVRPFDGNRRLRRSQVIRKVNSGFEILRPGTLKAPYESNDGTGWIGDLRGAGKRHSRKLHKKDREDSVSSYTLER